MALWPFKKKVSTLADAGLMQGLTDWHSHILPGVDDGIPDMEKSLETLREYEHMGVRRVWLTPHIMEDYDNETSALRSRFAELQAEWKGGVELRLGAENMLDSLFEDRLAARDFLPVGDEGSHLLVETSYFSPPMNFDDLIDEIQAAGYHVLLAHPERYRYMDETDYNRLKERGVDFQLNFMSTVGMYGETARKKAAWLLKEGMANAVGSDVHRLGSLQKMLATAPKSRDVLQGVLELARQPRLS